MDNFAALEILASINKLTSQISDMPKSNSSGFWQPWMGTIVGVIIGFSLNYLKDYFSQSLNVRKKLNSIRFEVEDIKDNAIYGLRCMIDYFNQYDKNPHQRIELQFPIEAVTSCFKIYYPDIAIKINRNSRSELIKTYAHAAYAEEMKNKIINELIDGGLNVERKNSYVIAMVQIYATTYHSANMFINYIPNSNFRVIDILNELGLESDFISKTNEINKKQGGTPP